MSSVQTALSTTQGCGKAPSKEGRKTMSVPLRKYNYLLEILRNRLGVMLAKYGEGGAIASARTEMDARAAMLSRALSDFAPPDEVARLLALADQALDVSMEPLRYASAPYDQLFDEVIAVQV